MDTMKTQFLVRTEGELAFDDRGSGPLVICIPGMGDLRAQYRYLVPSLIAAGNRVITLDLRGHGESSVRWSDYSVAGVGHDIVDLINHLDAGPAVIIGNSMAAGAAVWAAAEAPELIRGLVLIGPAVHGDMGLPFRLLVRLLFTRPWGASAWLWYFKTLFPSRLPQDWESYSAALKGNLAETGRLEALNAMMHASKRESEMRLERVNAPALILMGIRDPDFPRPAQEAEWVASRLNGEVRIVDGAGHYPHVEFPETTAPIIEEFLGSLPGVRTDVASGR